jgi:gas vesicle protein
LTVHIYLQTRPKEGKTERIEEKIDGGPLRGLLILKSKAKELKELGYEIKISTCIEKDYSSEENEHIQFTMI